MLSFIHKKLDAITMYRVVIYGLAFIIGAAFALSLADVLAIVPVALVLSLLLIVGTVLVVHELCVAVTEAPGNVESTLITGLILFLILTPPSDVRGAVAVAMIAALAVLLKYVIVHRKRHLFNPAALVLVVAGVSGYIGVEWWVGSRYLLPVVAIVGALIAMKTRREALVLTYIGASTAVVLAYAAATAAPLGDAFLRHFLSWPTVFFATVMLTEPLSLPSTRRLQYIYAVLAAMVGSVPFSIGFLYGTPELSLLAANLLTFFVDSPERSELVFVGRTEVGKDTFEYRFHPTHPLSFVPGQYMEWTLPHEVSDDRGIRRYFTICAAPGSETVSFAVRHLPQQSTWKKHLAELVPGAVMHATQRAGDFTLRHDVVRHVWIAGGIGITPYMSMLRDARARGTKLSAVLLYCNKTESDIAFSQELAQAADAGVAVTHVLAEKPARTMECEVGFVTKDVIERRVEGWQEATFYLSGPPGMVASYEKLLEEMGIPAGRIVTDYFPGLA